MSKNKTKQLVFSAMAIALATVISVVIKLPSLPNGGSTTLFSMLIVCLIGYWYGPVTGLIGAFAYGILQFITGPYVVHPAQVLLDYPLAFAALGLSGFFHNKKNGLITGFLVGAAGRFFFHMVSGLIFYTTYVDSFSGLSFTKLLIKGISHSLWIVPLYIGVNFIFFKSVFKNLIELWRNKA